MKKLISVFTMTALLSTSVIPCSCSSIFGGSKIEHHIELSQKGLEDLNKRLLDLEGQINPPIKKRLIKDLSYYAILTAALTFLANKAGYIKLPSTIEELKNIKFDKSLFSYAALGIVIRYTLHPFVKLLGIDDLGPLAYSSILAGLAMYRTGTDPVNKATIQATEMFHKVNKLVDQANDIAPVANDLLNQAQQNDVINKASETMDSFKSLRSWLPWNWFSSNK